MKKSQAILAFVPAVHKGYVSFFKAHKGDIFVMGDRFMKDYIHISRDLRVMKAGETVKALKALLPGRKIGAIESSGLKKWRYEKVIMPEDEISSDLAKRFFTGKKVVFAKAFLRWNKVITAKENEIAAHRKISRDAFDREIMDLAFKESKKSADWWRQVATMVVKDGHILYKSHNKHIPTDFHLSVNGDPRSNWNAGERQDIYTSVHSEAAAIAEAAKDGNSLSGAIAYVTTFPCPNCARLIGLSGIKKVYYSKGYSLLDAEKILKHFGVEIVLVK